MNKQREQLHYWELLENYNRLKGIEKRYYEYLPDECWKTEATQAEELKISRRKVQKLKTKFINEGLLQLELKSNGKRNNPRHLLLKTIPIILQERDDSSFRFSLPDDELSYYYYINEIDWSLLQSYTAEDINKMNKLEKIQLYMDCGFIVLPTYYPVFTETEVKCSCKDGADCPNIGKHPIHRYKFIDSFNYEFMKDFYLQEFEKNPALNIGFKVMGYSVLDVDNNRGGDGSLEHLIYEYNLDLTHAMTINCSNGQHIYVNNQGLKNTAGQIAAGLDIRSEGGFVVAPGSVHKSGRTYEWKLVGEIMNLPDEWFYSDSEEGENLMEKCGIQRENTAHHGNASKASIMLKDIRLPDKLSSDYFVPEGERELTLFKWGCRERGKGANANHIYDVLITIRDTYCAEGEKPISDEEIRNIANSAARYPTNEEKLLMGLKA
jgi:hypothetical protein